jgi:diguanylate cyclase (GGDEF)-like protein
MLQDLAQLVLRELDLRQLSRKCGTTKASNRWDFMAIAQRELRRSKELHKGLALLLVDFDSFSMINQAWGHEAGDQVLTQVAEFVRSLMRPADLLGRLGNAEFALLMVDVDLEDARAGLRAYGVASATCVESSPAMVIGCI